MREIIVVYPVKDVAMKLRHLFEQEGLYVSHICALGATALSLSQELSQGVIVCAERLSDMSAGNIAQLLPPDFDVVALTHGGTDSVMSNLVYLPLPLDRNELVSLVSSLAYSYSSFTRRSDNDKKLIDEAKQILMASQGIPETQAHKKLQQMSMAQGKSLRDIAKGIINKH